MSKTDPARRESFLARASHWAAEWTGTSAAFGIAFLIIVVWGATGPYFDYSNTWQLVINTGTTIVTFLMVFLIQRAQNKDSKAIHLKLNELVAAMKGASNRLINVESLTEDEIRTLHAHYGKLVELAKEESSLMESHSVDEAGERHQYKVSTDPTLGNLPEACDEPEGDPPSKPKHRGSKKSRRK